MTLTMNVKRVAAAGFGAVAVVTALPMGTAHADYLCSVNQNTWVRDYPSLNGNIMYTIPAGGGFRWTGGLSPNNWAHGNGNGGAIGWIPNDGRLRC